MHRLRASFLFAIALTTGCGDGDSAKTTDSCSVACQCYSPPEGSTVRKAYVPKCADAGSDASDASDAACEELLDCEGLCSSSKPASMTYALIQCSLVKADAGQTELECRYSPPPCGRATSGQRPPETEAWLEGALLLEARSVDSFERLAGELAFHGAPRALTEGAMRSARDEARHTRMMARLAGQPAPRITRQRRRVRSLRAIARENAVEGCVRERYGALLATYQSMFATDPLVRAVLARIAVDETRHAALAERVHAWAIGQLSERDRAAIDRARKNATERLRDELVGTAGDARLGLPDGRRAIAMLTAAV